jgi:hypothetical protein
VTSSIPEGFADAAIVNLGDPKVESIVLGLTNLGIYTIAHAGHKEKELIELGKQIKVNRVATNSEITNKLPQMLAEAFTQKS